MESEQKGEATPFVTAPVPDERERAAPPGGAGRAPFGLMVGAFLCAAWAALTALVLPLAAFGALPLSLGGEFVPAREWMRVAAPLIVVTALFMSAIAAGVATRRAWTRPLAPLLGCIVAVYAAVVGATGAVAPALAWRAALEGIALAAVTLWYFYRKASIVAYYRSLRVRRR